MDQGSFSLTPTQTQIGTRTIIIIKFQYESVKPQLAILYSWLPGPPVSGPGERLSGREGVVSGSDRPKMVPTGKAQNGYWRSRPHPPTLGQIRPTPPRADPRKIYLLGPLDLDRSRVSGV
eukprot:scaffold4641_cov117-Isochrysis_galbana.AAC.17